MQTLKLYVTKMSHWNKKKSTFISEGTEGSKKGFIVKVKSATVIEGDPKAPFLIATKPMYRGGRNSIPWIAPLYPWSVPYNAECLARRHQVPFFESLVWLDLGLNPGLSDNWRT